jgi:hypothetical protein
MFRELYVFNSTFSHVVSIIWLPYFQYFFLLISIHAHINVPGLLFPCIGHIVVGHTLYHVSIVLLAI